MKKIYLSFLLVSICKLIWAQNNSIIKGKLSDIEDRPVANANIYIDGRLVPEKTRTDGSFEIYNLTEGGHEISIISSDFEPYSEFISLNPGEIKELTLTIYGKGDIEHIAIFGENRQPEGLDAITRLPLQPREMAQNISIIPEEIIKEQGGQTITDVARNVPGVILFGSYGGVRESMSIRGYRGTPVLKNGVQVDSDFRSASLLSDMQGVESIQVLKGSAAITQGIGNGSGSPGGVINVVTKTPKFINGGNISLRSGSWGLFRPAFDYQAVLDKNQTTAFRINGVYQRSDSYKARVNNNRIYVNPSFEWRPDDKTQITLEMDYMNDNTTPNRGTVNLWGDDSENHLYEVPHNKFFGWGTDNVNTKTTTYSARIVRELGNNLSLRALYAGSVNKVENHGLGSIIRPLGSDYYSRSRKLGKSESEDKNQTIQVDLMGKDLYTGTIKHTFQVGFDYKRNNKNTTSYKDIDIDIINVLDVIPNNLPQAFSRYSFEETGRAVSTSEVFGIMAQEVIEFNKYIRLNLALRYSQDLKRTNPNAANEAWDPFIGLMVTPIKNISVFGNYATTTSLQSANNPTVDGGTVGASKTNQFELGIKSDWFNNNLGVNVTYFHIKNSDLSYQVYQNGRGTGLYEFAGDILRKGIDIEVTGKILDNLDVILGYSYLDAKYRNSIAYVNNSRPMNTPYNTANGWVRYLFNQGIFKNLSVGVGVYYVGDRPVNDYTSNLSNDAHGSVPGIKPFNMSEYTTVNAQLGYSYKNIGMQVFFNNIFDEIGYTSYYRGGFIDQIDPRNFKVQLTYNF